MDLPTLPLLSRVQFLSAVCGTNNVTKTTVNGGGPKERKERRVITERLTDSFDIAMITFHDADNENDNNDDNNDEFSTRLLLKIIDIDSIKSF